VKAAGRRLLWVFLPLLAGLIGLGWWRAVAAERETRRELEELRGRKQRIESAIQALDREVTSLKREREALARAAREALDAAAPGEVLVIVPQPSPTPAEGGK